jgi:hypothetical protein
MPDLTIANAATLTGAGTASGDLFPLLDISASAGSQGSKITRDELRIGMGITGGGTLATGGFTLTLPATGTAALRGTANVFTAAQTINAGTLTTAALTLSQTWNNAGVTCRGLELAVTDTNSASDSTLLRLLGGAAGTSARLAVTKIGSLALGATGVSNSITLTLYGSDRSGTLELGSFSNGLCATGSFDIKGNNCLLRFYNGNATVQYASLYGEDTNVLALRKGDGQADGASWEMLEMTAPATPAANRLRLYVEDNGSNKTRLVVKFSDGTTTVLATQP